MKVLVIGSGGREHTLAWKLAGSRHVQRVYVAPGNAGTQEDAENVDIPATDAALLIRFAKDAEIDLTVVGPEAPLVDGMVDAFEAEGLRIFGPDRSAAELEGSKIFCKDMLRHAGVPTAEYRSFRNAETAATFVREREDVPVVVKADGLAAGKGVFVCDNRQEAMEAVARLGDQREFGAAGDRLVIEERLHGQEASVLAITDGHTIATMAPAQDHKRAHDGDRGPNTGGMGACSPTPLIDDETLHQVEAEILVPTVHAMKRARRPFRGVLYAGLILTHQGPKVLEFNVRFGDPECQCILMRLKSDLYEVLDLAVDGRLDEMQPLEWDPRPAVCVVMASDGYPGPYERGTPIQGLDKVRGIPDVKVFHAGTATIDGQVVTNGGRVLSVTALGNSYAAAKLEAYTGVKAIRWKGGWCRTDIPDKAVEMAQ